jgi:anti-anti-sigma regulatory factor
VARRSRDPHAARCIVLGEDLRIANARAAYDDIVSSEGRVELDAAAVARIDAAGLQALAAAVIRLDAAKVAWAWRDVSPALATSATLAGLSGTLRLA